MQWNPRQGRGAACRGHGPGPDGRGSPPGRSRGRREGDWQDGAEKWGRSRPRPPTGQGPAGGASAPVVEDPGVDPDPSGRIPPAAEMVGVGGWGGEGPPGEKQRSQPAGGGFRQERCRREANASSWTTPGEFFTICCCWTTFYDGGGSIRSTAQMGRVLPPAEVMCDLHGGALGGCRGGAQEARRGGRPAMRGRQGRGWRQRKV